MAACRSPIPPLGCLFSFFLSLGSLEVDILWPRWVARIGVTRSTQACFLAADRQCTELPLLRLPRLVSSRIPRSSGGRE